MTSSEEIIYIFWSCKDQETAQKIVGALLEQKVIACGSIIPEVRSFYRWKGKIEESKEVKVIFKTMPSCFQAIENYIQIHGGYEIPEIVQVPIALGSAAFVAWVKQETSAF